MQMRLELIPLPVSDVDRAIAFYADKLGFTKDVDVRPSSEGYADLAHALDLRGSLMAAEATLLGALARRESRGAHQRRDFPQLDTDLRVNFRTRLDGTSHLTIDAQPVPPCRPIWPAGRNRARSSGWPGVCSSSRGHAAVGGSPTRRRAVLPAGWGVRRECPCGSQWSAPPTWRRCSQWS